MTNPPPKEGDMPDKLWSCLIPDDGYTGESFDTDRRPISDETAKKIWPHKYDLYHHDRRYQKAIEVLKDFARQRTQEETERMDYGHGDYEGAYDIMIGLARKVLAELGEK